MPSKGGKSVSRIGYLIPAWKSLAAALKSLPPAPMKRHQIFDNIFKSFENVTQHCTTLGRD